MRVSEIFVYEKKISIINVQKKSAGNIAPKKKRGNEIAILFRRVSNLVNAMKLE
jgi:hypothetical protein